MAAHDRADVISILVVEDHPVFREGLTTIIASQPDMRLVAQAGTAEDSIEAFRRHQPSVTLMDLRLPGANGIDALVTIRGEFPGARVIVLTTSESDGDIRRALRSGAASYLLKSAPREQLIAAIRAVHASGRYISPDVAVRLAAHLGEDDLTPRELEVLSLVREGYRTKQIADHLTISETTVSFHVKNLVGKLGAHDRAHAVAIAIRRGLLSV